MVQKKFNWEILSLARFLLAMVVLIGHLGEVTEVGFLKFYSALGSFEAILGFLLISGLSIGKSIAKNQDSYFKRRLQRIYPVYFASIIFQILVGGMAFAIEPILIVFCNLLFLNHIFINHSFVGPAWTLATEVWLYSLAPVFLKMSKKLFYILLFGSFISFAIYTCGRSLFDWGYYSGTNYGINLILLAFIWMAGFGLAIYPKEEKFTTAVVAIIIAGYLGLTIGIQVVYRLKHHQVSEILQVDMVRFVGSIISLAFSYYVVIWNRKVPTFSPRVNAVFHLLGNISYPLYLTHFTSFQLLQRWGVTNKYLFIGAALVIAYLIYYLFDFYSKKRMKVDAQQKKSVVLAEATATV